MKRVWCISRTESTRSVVGLGDEKLLNNPLFDSLRVWVTIEVGEVGKVAYEKIYFYYSLRTVVLPSGEVTCVKYVSKRCLKSGFEFSRVTNLALFLVFSCKCWLDLWIFRM
jgi:hypothetical protein